MEANVKESKQVEKRTKKNQRKIFLFTFIYNNTEILHIYRDNED